MLTKLKLQLKKQSKNWYWFLFLLSLIVGILAMLYEAKAQDTDMRNNLFTYASTIEQSIDWRPHAATLNTKPSQLKPADLAELEMQLKSACKANRDCHFIYLLYKENEEVKFLLDASPQPLSEISQLGEVFVEATDELKTAMRKQEAFVEGPVSDRWGTWVSVRMPIKSSAIPPNFSMLNIDVAVTNWNARILKAMIVPALATLVFLSIFGGFIYQNKKREKLLAQLYSSTSVLSAIANNDALTDLPNRRLLEDRMMQALKTAKRSDHIVAVLFLDLDYFKVVNDSYGHVVGDTLLKLVSARLTNLLRAEDTVARIGGDEFVILLPTLTDAEQAIAAAQKVVSEIAQPFAIAEHRLQVGVSVGVALYPEHADEPNDLISLADIAMYVAKRKGRNCYAIYQTD
jgi:diguanylate cyclase (GGDEF)-like protein